MSDTTIIDPGSRVPRHAAVDRLFHWLTAAAVLTLLATGILPVLGVQFSWATIHWITGVVLALAVLFHLLRATFWQKLRCMGIGTRDVRDTVTHALPGKYSLAQKLMHHAMSLVVLTAVVTGLCMLAKVDTPWWKRNPYYFAADAWGTIYVLHGLAALLAITLIMIHVYFSLLPEKRMYLRAMGSGWITRVELAAHHDPDRWQGQRDRKA
ncbi:MAG TPA: cytochrome b/b6 domain-containing protein [Steroidobacteraceae bacterium]|nr:cytochrome b/b6 domain-containing protein [Steroidobacteraceae bacterium]